MKYMLYVALCLRFCMDNERVQILTENEWEKNDQNNSAFSALYCSH